MKPPRLQHPCCLRGLPLAHICLAMAACHPCCSWAIDKDAATVSHPEVFAVFATVPLPGAVVQQPDDTIAYGAGQPGGNQYQPPAVAQV